MLSGRPSARNLALLTMVGTANYLDRYILSITLPLIRSEFKVNDAFIGFLSGPTFAVVYAVFGLPFGLLADRVGRQKVVAGSLAFFSAATLCCGWAGSFWQLVAARLATGLGEAGTTPSCTALIADWYPKERRSAALSFFAASANVGLFLAFFGGGWITEHYGWRTSFFASGSFGFLALILVCLLIRDLPRPIWHVTAPVSSRAALSAFAAQPVIRWVVSGAAIASMGGYAAVAFIPSFMARSHHMSPSAIGLTLALLSGTFGWAGTALPGLLADRWRPQDAGFGLKFAGLGLVLSLLALPLFFLAPDPRVMIVAAVPYSFFSAAFVGPSFAAVQRLTSAPMRARGSAFFLLVLNLVGLSLGPQMTGLLSHALEPELGSDALRYALLIVIVSSIAPAAGCFWRAGRLLQKAPASEDADI